MVFLHWKESSPQHLDTKHSYSPSPSLGVAEMIFRKYRHTDPSILKPPSTRFIYYFCIFLQENKQPVKDASGYLVFATFSIEVVFAFTVCLGVHPGIRPSFMLITDA